MKKMYCYVDETGQDTEGEFFLVALVLISDKNLEIVESRLEKIELTTGKKYLKWGKTPFRVRQDYLLCVKQVQELRESLYYSVYAETIDYMSCVSTAISDAVSIKGLENYQVTIVIDGLYKKGIALVKAKLKKCKVRYSKVKGLKDEQIVFLRLADAIAGFLRDVHEGQGYAQRLYRQLQKEDIFMTHKKTRLS